MPDFIVALIAAIVFCLSVVVLNALTNLAIGLHVAPVDLGENGFLQYGLALAAGYRSWRLAARRALA